MASAAGCIPLEDQLAFAQVGCGVILRGDSAHVRAIWIMDLHGSVVENPLGVCVLLIRIIPSVEIVSVPIPAAEAISARGVAVHGTSVAGAPLGL